MVESAPPPPWGVDLPPHRSSGPPEPPKRKRRWVRYVVAGLVILVPIGALAGMKAAQIGMLVQAGAAMEKAGPPPQVVAVAPAEAQEWEHLVTAIGSVATTKGVAISTDVSGVVTRISFESGADVKKGDVLVELDTRVERAQLASAMARQQLAKTTASKTKTLADTGAVPKAQLDTDETQLQASTTDVAALRGLVDKKTIRAPFAGKLGLRSVNVGQFLTAGTPVASVETSDGLHVDFTLPQQWLSDITIGLPARVEVDQQSTADAGAPRAREGAFAERKVEEAKPATMTGKIAAVDTNVDPVTRTIKARVDVDGDDQLRPGMFVRVAVVLPGKREVVAVPATAIIRAPYGDSVFVVEDAPADAGAGRGTKRARQQFVRLGESRGDFVAVTEGLEAKREVVVAGAFKLHNDTPVRIDNSVRPDPKLDPRPPNR